MVLRSLGSGVLLSGTEEADVYVGLLSTDYAFFLEVGGIVDMSGHLLEWCRCWARPDQLHHGSLPFSGVMPSSRTLGPLAMIDTFLLQSHFGAVKSRFS